MTEPIIPADDPSLVKVYDPRSLQGMINALAFFVRDVEGTIDEVSDVTGVSFAAELPNGRIVLTPTPGGRAALRVSVLSSAGGSERF